MLLKENRNFRQDASAALKRVNPALVVCGQDNIPADGPCLITMNHYYRPGFNAYWISFAISAAVPLEIHWVMTRAFTYPGQRREKVLKPMSRRVLHTIGRVYGFSNMPAMPPVPDEVDERAVAIRQVVAYARQHPKAVIGLAPEGRDILTGQLGEPPSGAGRFIWHLARMGLPILPVGVFEADGALMVNFGPVYDLAVPDGLSKAQADTTASRVVMRAIARQLPAAMRGAYG